MGYKYEIAIWVVDERNSWYNTVYHYEKVWTGNSRLKLWFALRKFKKQTGCLRLNIR